MPGARVLVKLRHQCGLPVQIVIDHGKEFTSRVLDQATCEDKVTLHFITPAHGERFHGKFVGQVP